MRAGDQRTASSSTSSPRSARRCCGWRGCSPPVTTPAAEDLVQTTLTRLYVALAAGAPGRQPGGVRANHPHPRLRRRAAPRHTGARSPPTTRRTRGPSAPRTTTTWTSRGRCWTALASWRRASARSSCSATASTSTSPRPPGSSRSPPAPSSPRTPRPSPTSAPLLGPASPSRSCHERPQRPPRPRRRPGRRARRRARRPDPGPPRPGRTRRRRGAAGLAGVAAAGIAGVGVGASSPPDPPVDPGEGEPRTRGGGITFLSQPFEAGPYTFDQTPRGLGGAGRLPARASRSRRSASPTRTRCRSSASW